MNKFLNFIFLDPLTSCNPIKYDDRCTSDAECPSKLACFDGVCKDPCIESKPCGRNAICMVENSLPVRTMVCECIRGYVGNAEVECRLRKLNLNLLISLKFSIYFYFNDKFLTYFYSL